MEMKEGTRIKRVHAIHDGGFVKLVTSVRHIDRRQLSQTHTHTHTYPSLSITDCTGCVFVANGWQPILRAIEAYVCCLHTINATKTTKQQNQKKKKK